MTTTGGRNDAAALPVERAADGAPLEWTLLRAGESVLRKEDDSGALVEETLRLTEDDLREIVETHQRSGELIPIDSEHWLYVLAKRSGLTESEALKLCPDGVAALGFGELVLRGSELRFRATRWAPSARPLLREGIWRYFSPVIRGFRNGPLRVTSVALTNRPAIENLDALVASANPPNPDESGRKENAIMTNQDEPVRDAGAAPVCDRDASRRESSSEAGRQEQLPQGVGAILPAFALLLGLSETAAPEEILAALKERLAALETAREDAKKADELAASAEAERHARLVARGRNEGKIAACDMDYVRSLDSRALSEYLDHAAPKVPLGTLSGEPARTRSAEPELTEEDEKAIKRLNLDREAFLALRRKKTDETKQGE